jgi:hypothetical protein
MADSVCIRLPAVRRHSLRALLAASHALHEFELSDSPRSGSPHWLLAFLRGVDWHA